MSEMSFKNGMFIISILFMIRVRLVVFQIPPAVLRKRSEDVILAGAGIEPAVPRTPDS